MKALVLYLVPTVLTLFLPDHNTTQTLMHTYSMNHVDISNLYEYLQRIRIEPIYLEIDEVAADTSLLTSTLSTIKRTITSLNHEINPKNMITIL